MPTLSPSENQGSWAGTPDIYHILQASHCPSCCSIPSARSAFHASPNPSRESVICVQAQCIRGSVLVFETSVRSQLLGISEANAIAISRFIRSANCEIS